MNLTIIRAMDLERYMKRKDVYLIDIRKREDFLRYHIDGAINVPEDKIDVFLKQKGTGPFYILCCERGISSVKVGRRLYQEGYRVGTVAGGVTAYKKL